MTDTPELDKLSEASEERQTVADFLEWLNQKGISLVRWREDQTQWAPCDGLVTGWLGETNCHEGKLIRTTKKDGFVHEAGSVCPICQGEGGKEIKAAPRYVPINDSDDDLIFQYLGLDPKTIEMERRALLASLRS